MRFKKLKLIGIVSGMIIVLTGCDNLKSLMKKDNQESIEPPIISEFNSENTNTESIPEENSKKIIIQPSVRNSIEDSQSETLPVENQNLPENEEILPEEEKIEEGDKNSIKPETRESDRRIIIERLP